MPDHIHHHGAGAPAGRGHRPPAQPAGHPDGSGPEHHAGHDPADHDRHASHSVAGFRRRFWIALVLTLPTLLLGHMLPAALGYAPPDGTRWVAPLFGTAVFGYGGWAFLQGAWRELRAGVPGMMTLISLAIAVAFGFSVAVLLGFPGRPLWEELATLVTIMLLGHWIEMRSISQAEGALQALVRLLPRTAVRVTGEESEEVPLAALIPGDVVLVRPGAAIPADGVVQEGQSAVNEAMLTGESAPVAKRPGAKVIAGTVNGAGSLRVEVTGTGEATALAGIMRLVRQAQTSRSRAQVLADRAARWLTGIALAAGALTLTAWLVLSQDPAFAVERAVTVLVIACPHALGLAVPLVVAISTTLGAQQGLLVRDRRGLEEARRLDTIVFDKTGTLTRGEFGVVELVAPGRPPEEALAAAASVEAESEHPIAQGIVQAAAARGIAPRRVQGFTALPGRGAQARLDGVDLFVGGPALVRERGWRLEGELRDLGERAARDGRAVVYLGDPTTVWAGFAVGDVVREEAREAVTALQRRGLEVVMLTGDARSVAEAVGRELGITRVLAEVLPDQKAGAIAELRQGGHRVGMVGDGVNDAPALLGADVGIAIGAGTDVAVEAGDIVLVRNDPRDIVRLIRLSRHTYRKMVQNLWWASGYNILAIPLAAGILAGAGILLTPAVGAVLMSLSTVLVAVNAQLLRRGG